jgi:hypothetical protein
MLVSDAVDVSVEDPPPIAEEITAITKIDATAMNQILL